MNSDQYTGLGILVFGMGYLVLSITTIPGSGEAYDGFMSVLVGAGKIVPAVCLAGIGIGVYTGRFDTADRATPTRTVVVLATIAFVAVAAGAMVALT